MLWYFATGLYLSFNLFKLDISIKSEHHFISSSLVVQRRPLAVCDAQLLQRHVQSNERILSPGGKKKRSRKPMSQYAAFSSASHWLLRGLTTSCLDAHTAGAWEQGMGELHEHSCAKEIYLVCLLLAWILSNPNRLYLILIEWTFWTAAVIFFSMAVFYSVCGHSKAQTFARCFIISSTDLVGRITIYLNRKLHSLAFSQRCFVFPRECGPVYSIDTAEQQDWREQNVFSL